MKDIVEASEERTIEQMRSICSCDDHTLRLILLYELEKRIQDAAHLANVVVQPAIPTNCIKLIEKINARVTINDIKDLPKFRCCLAHKLRD